MEESDRFSMLNINCLRLDVMYLEESCKFILDLIDKINYIKIEDENLLFKALFHYKFECESQVRKIHEFITLNFNNDGEEK